MHPDNLLTHAEHQKNNPNYPIFKLSYHLPYHKRNHPTLPNVDIFVYKSKRRVMKKSPKYPNVRVRISTRDWKIQGAYPALPPPKPHPQTSQPKPCLSYHQPQHSKTALPGHMSGRVVNRILGFCHHGISHCGMLQLAKRSDNTTQPEVYYRDNSGIMCRISLV